MKKISIIIVQTLLLIFSIYLYKMKLDERRKIKNNGTIKVYIMQVKDKGKYGVKYNVKYGVKYNVKYQDKIYYNIVGLDRNLKENSYDTQNFYYDNENNTIFFKEKNLPAFNVTIFLFLLSFVLWFLPERLLW